MNSPTDIDTKRTSEIKLKGKVDRWFYAMIVGCNIFFLYLAIQSLLNNPDLHPTGLPGALVLIATALFVNLLCIPMIVKNYVVFKDNTLFIKFAFFKTDIDYGKIKEAKETNNPLSSWAASLDRISIKHGYDEIMIAVKDKDRFFQEMSLRAPNAKLERKPDKLAKSPFRS